MDIIYENILSNGSIIASRTQDPDYNFHWTRDSAIVIKALIDAYNKDNSKGNYIYIFNNYINIELEHIKYHPAEPKFNIDGTPFIGNWGRPQNDGPALRSIVCLKLINILSNRLESLIKIINTDISYTINNLVNPSFDLWEEIYGFHLYTRIIQFKFLFNINKLANKFKFIKFSDDIVEKAYKNVMDHFSKDSDKIFSSYSTDGTIIREYDSSLLLTFTFLDYDIPRINIKDERIEKYINNMVLKFNNEFKINKKLNIPFLGRYLNDKYFDGNPWLISTIALFNYYYSFNNLDKHKKEFDNFLNFIKKKNIILSEQIDKNDGSNVSVEKLTWNYAELIMFFNKKENNILKIVDLFLL